MKNTNHNVATAKRRTARYVGIAGALALVVTMTACNRADNNATVGEKLDSAVAKTEQAANEAKVSTENSMANAGNAVKNATTNAEVSGKNMANNASVNADDAVITARVSSNFAKDPDLSAIKIDVDTRAGAVTLTGTAPTEAAKAKAATIAKGLQGVSSVDNKLVVTPG